MERSPHSFCRPFRSGYADDLRAGLHLFRQKMNECLGSRPGANSKSHAAFDFCQGCPGSFDFQFCRIHDAPKSDMTGKRSNTFAGHVKALRSGQRNAMALHLLCVSTC